MLKTLARIGFSALKPKSRATQNPREFDDVNVRLPAPKASLVDHYRRWCRYSVTAPDNATFDTSHDDSTIPSHMFSQFALSVCAKQLKLTRYNLSSVINQGVGVTVHQPLPAGEPLDIRCKLIDITEADCRARVQQRLYISTESAGLCTTVDFHAVFILGRNRRSKPREAVKEQLFDRLGSWTVAENDGWNFALLTGDFNPIHWVGLIAKLSPFKRKVLHGFGMFTRSWETAELALGKPLKVLDVRFVSPAFLNNQAVSVYKGEADEEGLCALELRDAKGRVLMAGRIGV